MLVHSLPDPYGREIKGISSATGIPLGKIYNCLKLYILYMVPFSKSKLDVLRRNVLHVVLVITEIYRVSQKKVLRFDL
jgi:hypothetical protein